MKKTHFFKCLKPVEKKEAALPAFLHTYVHPCVIDNQPHIVYPRGLAEKSPDLFSKLTQHYQQQGYLLKEDKRSDKSSNKYKNQRRKWAPILLFTASLVFESSAFADVELDVNEKASLQQQQNIELQLISNNKIREQIQYSVKPSNKTKQYVQIKSDLAQSLFKVLSSRYKQKVTDPNYIVDDLKKLRIIIVVFQNQLRCSKS